MGHDIDLPDSRPARVRSLGAAANTDAGVGTEEVYGTLFSLNGLNEGDDVRLPGDVGCKTPATNFGGHGHGAWPIKISTDDATRSLLCETPGHGSPDPSSGAGDDHDFAL